jgi:hypothetical protein
MMKTVLFTKYQNWEYEREIRTWTDLEEEFFEFCEVLRLVEVIVGAECQLPNVEIERALGSQAGQVTMKRARAAYNGFQMVENA